MKCCRKGFVISLEVPVGSLSGIFQQADIGGPVFRGPPFENAAFRGLQPSCRSLHTLFSRSRQVQRFASPRSRFQEQAAVFFELAEGRVDGLLAHPVLAIDRAQGTAVAGIPQDVEYGQGAVGDVQADRRLVVGRVDFRQ